VRRESRMETVGVRGKLEELGAMLSVHIEFP
jgi:hypothetical protein